MTTRYRLARTQAGLTMGQSSRMVSIDVVRLSNIELDREDPTPEEQATMAARYMCSVEWMRGDDIELPSDFKRMLRNADISDHDRDVVLQFAQSLPRNGKTASERLDGVAAHQAEVSDVSRADKARYVRGQGQTRKHHCHWPGCDMQVPPAMWGCKGHWFRLPKKLRDRIWQTFVPGQEVDMSPSAEYLQVADDVQAWILEERKENV